MIASIRRYLRFGVFYLFVSCLPAGAAEVTLQAPDLPDTVTDRLISASVSIKASNEETASAQDLIAAARADYGRLVSVLYSSGYYGGTVSILVDGREAANLSLLNAPPDVQKIVLHVKSGPHFVFSHARVSPLAPGTELPEGFLPGQLAKSDLIVDAARAGVEGWREEGHAKADVSKQTITADHRSDTLSADIQLSPGPRLRFGDLEVGNDGNVRAKRIKEIAALPTGEVFSPDVLKTAAENLRRTGSFQSVALGEADTPNPDGSLDVTAELTAATPRRIGFGAELSSLEGVTLSSFWLHRNLFGGAERLRLDAEIGGIGGDSGGIDYSFGARFERPATFSPNTDLFLDFRIQQSDEPDFRERSVQIGGGLKHRFSSHLSGETGLSYRFSDINDDLGSRTLQYILLPSKLTWDSRDNELDARRGSFLALDATPFIGLNRNIAGARIFADVRKYQALGASENGVVLAGRVQVGSVMGASSADVPPEFLFFSGGAGTVRGQPYQSLSVNLGGGLEIGGRSFLGLSGEVRAPVSEKISAVAFVDAGYIGEDSIGFDNGEWQGGSGFGIRYDTGIGPIRLDVGTPLDSDAGSQFEFYIGIGQAF